METYKLEKLQAVYQPLKTIEVLVSRRLRELPINRYEPLRLTTKRVLESEGVSVLY